MSQESVSPTSSESMDALVPQDDHMKFFNDTLEIIDSKIAYRGKRVGQTLLNDRAQLQAEIDRLNDPEYPRTAEDRRQISVTAKVIVGRNNPEGLLDFNTWYNGSLEKDKP
jgi:hypothetical protein